MNRVGNTLYNVLDKYTGEQVTYNKVTSFRDGTVMTDGKVDGVVYRKYGDEYFKRNTTTSIKPEWFGAKGDGITDDSVSIQNLINFLPEGGTIEFAPDKTYIANFNINKPLITINGNGSTLKGKITIGDGVAREYNIRISKFKFDNTTSSIEINKGRRIHIFDNHFINSDKSILMTPTTGFHHNAQIYIFKNTFVNVNYCWYSTVSDGISWDVLSDCYFSNNIINSALITPVQLQGIDGLTATDNTFFFSNTIGIRETKEHHFKITLQSDWVTFQGNKFFEAGYESLYLERCRHLIVDGNHFARSGQRVTRSTIYLTGDPTSAALEKPTFIISNNTVSLFSKDFIEIDPNTYCNLSATGNTINYNNFFSQYFGGDTLSALTHYTINTGEGKNTKILITEENNTPPVEPNHIKSSGNISIKNRAISDFNNFIGEGFFYSTTSPTNGPIVGFGQGIRVYVDNNSFSYKDLFCFGTDWYKRSGTTSSPGTWYKMYDAQNIKTDLQSSFLTNQTAIDNTSSLDTFQTQGVYARGSDSGNTVILGYPYDNITKGILIVLRFDSNNISQQYKFSNGRSYSRYFTASTWSGWIEDSNNIKQNISNIKTANYNLTSEDRTILFDSTSGNLIANLPTASSSYLNGQGHMYTIKKVDASVNTITVDGNLSETIDGNTTYVLTTQWQFVTIQSNGTSWYIVGKG